MQKIAFAIGHLLEWTFTGLAALGWLPVILTTIVLFFGLIYWLALQGKYNRRAKAENTLA
ncbi:MAG: hypothetical protein IPM46_08540 [Flavobacteriales bacterium]|nr:hypothetical protein [Flavobacteriales bacterium]